MSCSEENSFPARKGGVKTDYEEGVSPKKSKLVSTPTYCLILQKMHAFCR